MRLSEARVVLTGASSGIGLATAAGGVGGMAGQLGDEALDVPQQIDPGDPPVGPA